MKEKVNKKECPPKLKVLIDIANLFPPGYTNPWAGYYALNPFPDIESNRKKFIELVDELPDKFIKANQWIERVINRETKILDRSLPSSMEPRFSDILSFYEYELEKGLWLEIDIDKGAIIDFNPLAELDHAILNTISCRKEFLEIIAWNELPQPTGKRGFPINNTTPWVYIDEGIIRTDLFKPVLDLIESEKIDIRRLLRCPICQKIVWKKQSTAESCGNRKCVERQKYLRKKSEEVRRKDDEQKRKLRRQNWNNQDFSKQED